MCGCLRPQALVRGVGSSQINRICYGCSQRLNKPEPEEVQRSCIRCGNPNPTKFYPTHRVCGRCYHFSRKNGQTETLRTTLEAQTKTEVPSWTDEDKEVLRKWQENFDRNTPPGYANLRAKVRFKPPILKLKRECAGRLMAERAGVGPHFYKDQARYKKPEDVRLCECKYPDQPGHFRLCSLVVTRGNSVKGNKVLTDVKQWERLWEWRRSNLNRLRREGRL